MSNIHITTTHLDVVRTEQALRARDALVAAARTWAAAPKHQVGAVALPAGPAAARAFASMLSARSELAHHVGGDVAAVLATAAVAEAAHTRQEGGPHAGKP